MRLSSPLAIALVALAALAACQKPAPRGAGQGKALLQSYAQTGKPQTGVIQIETSGSPRGFALRLPPAKADAQGRTATVSLPYRPKDGFVWTLDGKPGEPWSLTASATKPGAGPEGTDLAVFSFTASGPGAGNLSFRLGAPPNPASKSPSGGDKVLSYQATVSTP